MTQKPDTDKNAPMPTKDYPKVGGKVLDSVFYGTDTIEEARRLHTMAEYYNPVSLESVLSLSKRINGDEESLVVDVGAGENPDFGKTLETTGAITYLPLDIRGGAVRQQQDAGFRAIQSTASLLDIPPNIHPDVFHARFTWAWLDAAQREKSFIEMLRVSSDEVGLSIIDYDWSSASGPDVFMDAVMSAQEKLREAGFNPEYGSQVTDEMKNLLDSFIRTTEEDQVELEARLITGYEGPIRDAKLMIDQTGAALIEQLKSLGLAQKANELEVKFDSLQQYMLTHGDEIVRLPSVTAVNVIISEKHKNLTPLARHRMKDNEEELKFRKQSRSEIFDKSDGEAPLGILGELNVLRASSDRMVDGCRRVQALAYFDDGIVTRATLGEDGMLIHGNDPLELVARSDYFARLSKQGTIRSAVRMIHEDERGIGSIPTVQRLIEHSPETMKTFKDHDMFRSGKKVIEVSGLAKEMIEGSFDDVVLAVLALADEGYRQGVDYGIMGLQSSKIELIESFFGKEAIQRIEGEDAVHSIDLPGVSEAVTFVPIYVSGREFISQVHTHAKKQAEQFGNEKMAQLEIITAEILRARNNQPA